MVEDIARDKKATDEGEKSKMIKVISNLGFIIFMIFMTLLIFMTAQSRLTGQEPSLFGHRMYIVDSGSMEPTLPINSLIIIKESTADKIGQGDIVTYFAEGGSTRVTHRIAEVLENNEGFITQGDANNTEDASILKSERIIGKLAFSIPYVGLILRQLNSKLGISVLLVIISLMVIVPMIVKKFSKV